MCFVLMNTGIGSLLVWWSALGSQFDLAAQAREVFDRLRAFDDTDVTQIWAQCPSDEGLGLAVANRIKKAAGFAVIQL